MASSYLDFRVRIQKDGEGIFTIPISSTSEYYNTSVKIFDFIPRLAPTGTVNETQGTDTISGDAEFFISSSQTDTRFSMYGLKKTNIVATIGSTTDEDYASDIRFYSKTSTSGYDLKHYTDTVSLGGNLSSNPVRVKCSSVESGYIYGKTDYKTYIFPQVNKTAITDRPFIIYDQTDNPLYIDFYYRINATLTQDAVNFPSICANQNGGYQWHTTAPRVYTENGWKIARPKVWNGTEWVDLYYSTYDI